MTIAERLAVEDAARREWLDRAIARARDLGEMPPPRRKATNQRPRRPLQTCIGPGCDRLERLGKKGLCTGHDRQRRRGLPLSPLRAYRRTQ